MNLDQNHYLKFDERIIYHEKKNEDNLITIKIPTPLNSNSFEIQSIQKNKLSYVFKTPPIILNACS